MRLSASPRAKKTTPTRVTMTARVLPGPHPAACCGTALDIIVTPVKSWKTPSMEEIAEGDKKLGEAAKLGRGRAADSMVRGKARHD
jgi:hypothetical protein